MKKNLSRSLSALIGPGRGKRRSVATLGGSGSRGTASARRTVLTVGAFVAVAGIVGSGFVLQSAAADQATRETATAALSESTGMRAEQLGVYDMLFEARATEKAELVLAAATPVIIAASGKTDATALAATVAALEDHEQLAADRILTLANEAEAQAAVVQAAVVEVERVAAEQAEQAAAAAAAAATKRVASSRPSAPTDPSGAQAIARDMMLSQYGWGEAEFGCLVALWNKESGWNANAYNASSGAAGIPQALPGSKMAAFGADWQTNPATQIAWGLSYISGRYGTPCAAWDSAQANGWY